MNAYLQTPMEEIPELLRQALAKARKDNPINFIGNQLGEPGSGKTKKPELIIKLEDAILGLTTIGVISTTDMIDAHKKARSPIGMKFIEADERAAEEHGTDLKTAGHLQDDEPVIAAASLELIQFIENGKTRIFIDAYRTLRQFGSLRSTELYIQTIRYLMSRRESLVGIKRRNLQGHMRTDDAKVLDRYDRHFRENNIVLKVAKAQFSKRSVTHVAVTEPLVKQLPIIVNEMGYSTRMGDLVEEVLRDSNHPIRKEIDQLEGVDKLARKQIGGLAKTAVTA